MAVTELYRVRAGTQLGNSKSQLIYYTGSLDAATDESIHQSSAGHYTAIVSMQFVEGTATDLSFISGSNTAFTMELPANSGISKDLSKEAMFITDEGEALKLNASTGVSSILIGVMEFSTFEL
jgi:hypothetical protein